MNRRAIIAIHSFFAGFLTGVVITLSAPLIPLFLMHKWFSEESDTTNNGYPNMVVWLCLIFGLLYLVVLYVVATQVFPVPVIHLTAR